MAYTKWQNYLVRRGLCAKTVGFILPKDANRLKTIDVVESAGQDALNALKKALKDACEGKDRDGKNEILQNFCKVNSFDDFKEWSNKEIYYLAERLKKMTSMRKGLRY